MSSINNQLQKIYRLTDKDVDTIVSHFAQDRDIDTDFFSHISKQFPLRIPEDVLQGFSAAGVNDFQFVGLSLALGDIPWRDLKGAEKHYDNTYDADLFIGAYARAKAVQDVSVDEFNTMMKTGGFVPSNSQEPLALMSWESDMSNPSAGRIEKLAMDNFYASTLRLESQDSAVKHHLAVVDNEEFTFSRMLEQMTDDTTRGKVFIRSKNREYPVVFSSSFHVIENDKGRFLHFSSPSIPVCFMFSSALGTSEYDVEVSAPSQSQGDRILTYLWRYDGSGVFHGMSNNRAGAFHTETSDVQLVPQEEKIITSYDEVRPET